MSTETFVSVEVAGVVLNGRDAAALDRAAAGLRSGGLDVDAHAFDVTDPDPARDAVTALGEVDVQCCRIIRHGTDHRRRRRDDDDFLISAMRTARPASYRSSVTTTPP